MSVQQTVSQKELHTVGFINVTGLDFKWPGARVEQIVGKNLSPAQKGHHGCWKRFIYLVTEAGEVWLITINASDKERNEEVRRILTALCPNGNKGQCPFTSDMEPNSKAMLEALAAQRELYGVSS